jgi:GcrA cell cycle regulator
VQMTKDELNELIFKDWDAGFSAKAIGEKYGISRNSVIGKVHRARVAGRNLRIDMGLAEQAALRAKARHAREHEMRLEAIAAGVPMVIQRTLPKPQKPRTRYAAVPKPKLVTAPPPIALPTTKERWVPLLELAHETCRFTTDGNKFCNAPAHMGSSWCEEHFKRVFSPRERDARAKVSPFMREGRR